MTVGIAIICNTNCHYVEGQSGLRFGNTGKHSTRPNNGNPAVPSDLTTARDPTRAPQPKYDIPQTTEQEPVDESMGSGRSYH